jgi:hypothetical protein
VKTLKAYAARNFWPAKLPYCLFPVVPPSNADVRISITTTGAATKNAGMNLSKWSMSLLSMNTGPKTNRIVDNRIEQTSAISA